MDSHSILTKILTAIALNSGVLLAVHAILIEFFLLLKGVKIFPIQQFDEKKDQSMNTILFRGS